MTPLQPSACLTHLFGLFLPPSEIDVRHILCVSSTHTHGDTVTLGPITTLALQMHLNASGTSFLSSQQPQDLRPPGANGASPTAFFIFVSGAIDHPLPGAPVQRPVLFFAHQPIISKALPTLLLKYCSVHPIPPSLLCYYSYYGSVPVWQPGDS